MGMNLPHHKIANEWLWAVKPIEFREELKYDRFGRKCDPANPYGWNGTKDT